MCRGVAWAELTAEVTFVIGVRRRTHGFLIAGSKNQGLFAVQVSVAESFGYGTLIFFINCFKYQAVSCIMKFVVMSLLTLSLT